MENNPEEPIGEYNPRYYGTHEGKEIYFGPENTTIYLYANTPEYDNLFIMNEDADDENEGFFVWRRKVQESLGEDVFREMVRELLDAGCTPIFMDVVSNVDREAYISEFGTELPEEYTPLISKPELKNTEAPKLESHELTPRQERLCDFMAYLLLHERLAIEDFNGNGELWL